MQTLTFSCPHCKNLMAVVLDLLGRQVQCPTCKKVIIAPNAVPTPQAANAPAEPKSSGSGSEILFELGKEEDTDSIFGEVQDEDVFGSRPPRLEIPEGPPLTPNPPDRPASNFATFAPGMPPMPASNGLVEAAQPATDPPIAAVKIPQGQPLPEPETAPSSTQAQPDQWLPAESESNHWPSVGSNEPSFAADAHLEAPPIRRPIQSREQRRLSSLMLTILGPYSVIVTMLAGYYFIKARNAAEASHPFAQIPDIRAQFDPAVRHQFTAILQKMPSPDAELPDKLKVKLGDTIRIGSLEVTPERIERTRLKEYTVLQNYQINSLRSAAWP